MFECCRKKPAKPSRELPSPIDDIATEVPRLAIVVGHTKKAKGAALVNGVREYDFNKEIAEEMVRVQGSYGVECAVFYRDNGGRYGAYKRAQEWGADLQIELHFNAFNKNVRGTETLCSTNTEDYDYALMVQKQMCTLFEREGLSRGVKRLRRGDRAATNVYGYSDRPINIPNCLPEPAFGDNTADAELLIENQYRLARVYLEASKEFWLTKVSQGPIAPPPTKPPQQPITKYLWEPSNGAKSEHWGPTAILNVRAHDWKALLDGQTPRDIMEFFPAWESYSREKQKRAWMFLLSAMSRYESNYNPDTKYQENFRDRNGDFIISRGLLQLSQESLTGYGFRYTIDEIHDPVKNLVAGIGILAKWVPRDGQIADDSAPWRGGARYWSVLRYKTKEIQKLTRRFV